MQIFVKSLAGRTYPFEVEPTESVEDFREKIEAQIGVAPEDQSIIFHGVLLEDGPVLSDYGIQKDSTLLLLMEIFVETDNQEKIMIFVSPSHTIANVKTLVGKEMYKGKGDAKRYEDLRLTFDGKQLEDGRNLSHYGIQKESELQLLFEIYVITEEQEGILLHVSSSELVANVKAKLGKELGIPRDEQRLSYRGVQLEDYQRLGDYKVKKNAVISLVHEFQISVQTPRGKLLSFPVKQQMTVQNLKEMVQDFERFPADEQRLMFKGQRLQDDKTLGDYSIAEGKVLELELLQIIKVQCASGRFQISTWPSETITDIKREICSKLKITFDGYRLLFQCHQIPENATVAKCGITHGDILFLEKEITLNITEQDKPYPLTMWPSDTAGDVKSKIEEVHGIKTAEQRLSLDGKQLNDESLLGNHETLSMTLELRRDLHVRSSSGESRSYHIWPSDNVLDIKQTVAREENMVSTDVLLLHGRHAVNNDCPIADLGVSRMFPLQILQRPHSFFVIVWNVEENSASCVETNMSAKVGEMKAEVCRQMGFKNEVLLLFHRNFLLEDNSLLMDLGIVSATTVSLVKRRPNGTIVMAHHKPFDCYDICAAALTNEIDAKVIISKQLGVRVDQLEVIFQSSPLHEEQQLGDQGIKEGSIIGAMSETGEDIHVTVKPVGQSTALSLRVAPSETIKDLKSNIEEKMKLPKGNQFLYFKGEMLNDTNQISDYNICDYSLLTLICQVHFSVMSLDSHQAELHVEHNLSVEGLKMLLVEMFCIPMKRQRLLIEGKELLDYESLWNCAVLLPQPVMLAMGERKLMWIFIRWNDRLMNVSASPSDTIFDLKMEIFKQTGIAIEQQALSYEEEILQDDLASLEDKGIQENAELALTRSQKIQIVVIVTGTKRIAVSISETVTVDEIKTEIQKLTDPPLPDAAPAEDPADAPQVQIRDLKVYFKGNELNSESRISKCGIQNGSVITFIHPGGMDVNVRCVCGFTTKIKVLPDASLEDVKRAISEKSQLNENLLGIFIGTTEWKDSQNRAWQMNIDCSVTIFVTRSDMDAFWLFAAAEGAIKGFVAGPGSCIGDVSSKMIEELDLYNAHVTFYLDRKR